MPVRRQKSARIPIIPGGVTAAVSNGEERNVVRKLGLWRGAEMMEQRYVKDSADIRGLVMVLTPNTNH